MKPHLPYLIVIAALAVVITSCKPTGMLRRAERLIAKAERGGAKITADTVFKEVIIKVPEIRVDTVVDFTYDTITVMKDNIITKVKIDRQTQKIYVQTEQKIKEVIVRVPYTVTRTISAGYTLWQLIGAGVFGLVLGALLGKLLWK